MVMHPTHGKVAFHMSTTHRKEKPVIARTQVSANPSIGSGVQCKTTGGKLGQNF